MLVLSEAVLVIVIEKNELIIKERSSFPLTSRSAEAPASKGSRRLRARARARKTAAKSLSQRHYIKTYRLILSPASKKQFMTFAGYQSRTTGEWRLLEIYFQIITTRNCPMYEAGNRFKLSGLGFSSLDKKPICLFLAKSISEIAMTSLDEEK